MADEPNADELAAALYSSIGLLARRLRKAPAPGELTLPERSVLHRLDYGGPATAAELARAEQITAQAMGTTFARLEERGLVERRPDPGDGRRVILSLAEAGARLLRHKADVRAQQLSSALAANFTAAELETLTAAAPLLERLGEAF
jgi:DNA-binding MarR family transcriptional regulator